jgi:hypothetical protein
VKFINGLHKVSRTLHFNSQGEFTNFASDDRGALQAAGSFRIPRWSTPMRNYKDFNTCEYATEGEAIRHYP